jgi:hypothetical protein
LHTAANSTQLERVIFLCHTSFFNNLHFNYKMYPFLYIHIHMLEVRVKQLERQAAEKEVAKEVAEKEATGKEAT